MSAPRNPSATQMNATAVPWPNSTRSNIPATTVHSQTTTPLVSVDPARPCARTQTQPMRSPTAKGHAVEAKPLQFMT